MGAGDGHKFVAMAPVDPDEVEAFTAISLMSSCSSGTRWENNGTRKWSEG